jgi:DNA-binding NarL/FixJ family response regulator
MLVDRILIADDHAIVRKGLKLVVSDFMPGCTCDEACNGDEVFSLVKKNDYGIIILDINMPYTDAIALITNLLVYQKESKILVFSMNAEDLYAKRFLKLGAKGYLHKESKPEEIRKALQEIMAGKIYMSPQLKEKLMHEMVERKADNPFERLSDREIEIVRYFLLGYSVNDIKKTLNLHASTIGTYKMRLFQKLKVKNAFELSELANLYQMNFTKTQA